MMLDHYVKEWRKWKPLISGILFSIMVLTVDTQYWKKSHSSSMYQNQKNKQILIVTIVYVDRRIVAKINKAVYATWKTPI